MKTQKINKKSKAKNALVSLSIIASFILIFSFYFASKARAASPYGWVLSGNHVVTDVTGFVGIGTTTPSAKLHVNGGSIVNTISMGTDVAGINYPYEYETIGVTNTNLNLRLQSPSSLVFHTGGTLAANMILTPSGTLGLGTTSPLTNAKLHLASGDLAWGNESRLKPDQGGSIELGGDNDTPGGGSPYIDFHHNGLTQDRNTRIINNGNGLLTMEAGTLQVTGNLGVGTSAPGAKLHVTGGAIANGIVAGGDAGGINYPFEYETIGVAGPSYNLRLQSPNSIIMHTGNSTTPRMVVSPNGEVCIGNCQ